MTDPAYRAAPADALRIEPLGELTAIFDRRSMQTHLVVAPLPEMLALMGEGPCDAALLVKRLETAFDLSNAGDVRARVAERLAELADMGLVAKA
ncbi:HPr-rel-A system PqqD family peptide chaperone [Sphingopyxis kveilinensis]|uniref:HPr-rel-A system PqqD family peptide chaperone n=1 Tax=Sphingopyxis kveilinensis TaxID=3114367 RepID=UPI0030CCDC78